MDPLIRTSLPKDGDFLEELRLRCSHKNLRIEDESQTSCFESSSDGNENDVIDDNTNDETPE